MNKQLFYEKVQPYVDEKLIREIYSSDDISIFNFGDLYYIGCPHFLYNNQFPFGVRIPVDFLEEIIKDNSLLILYIKSLVDSNKFNENAPFLTEENLDYFKKYFNSYKDKRGMKGYIDYDLEEKISNENINKSRK